MNIWVDADACPVVIRDILFRAAQRTSTRLTLVANQPMQTPPGELIRSLQVGAGFDKADEEIVARTSPGDLVITSDIPLAADVIAKGALALSPRGELFDASNIRARLNMRDFLDSMRSSGFDTGGPPAFNQKDRKQFADHLDRLLAKSRLQNGDRE
ncbi:MAG: YaiI/YqxD family protein [Gammaproteobacteria bacterium]|nr:YaiI/YqxD family protein [Pseudomonadales bacterium]MCP5349127.1 YaiI/YqxD family protein [Pseudomonadales bacterium]